MSDKFLDKVYTKLNSDETKAIYDAWATAVVDALRAPDRGL